jgi:hypothetical protein
LPLPASVSSHSARCPRHRVNRILDTSRSLSTRAGNLLLALVLVAGTVGTTFVGLVGINPAVSATEDRDEVDPREAAQNNTSDRNNAQLTPADNHLIKVRGQVVDSDGKPLARATVRMPNDLTEPPQSVLTGNDAKFELTFDRSKYSKPQWHAEPWRQAYLYATAEGYAPAWMTGDELASDHHPTLTLRRDDLPIRGQVLTLEGEPVPRAMIEVWDIYEPRAGTLDELLRTIRDSSGMFQPFLNREMRYFPSRLLDLHAIQGTLGRTEARDNQIITTDDEGNFEVYAVGRERLLRANVTGRNIHSAAIQIVTRPDVDRKWQRQALSDQERMILNSGVTLPEVFGATFQHLAGPSFPITGTVRDRETGEPIARTQVSAWLRNTSNHASAITDELGHYELTGLAAQGTCQQLTAGPADGATLPYIGVQRSNISYSATSPPTKEVTDFQLTRGLIQKGMSPPSCSLRTARINRNRPT